MDRMMLNFPRDWLESVLLKSAGQVTPAAIWGPQADEDDVIRRLSEGVSVGDRPQEEFCGTKRGKKTNKQRQRHSLAVGKCGTLATTAGVECTRSNLDQWVPGDLDR